MARLLPLRSDTQPSTSGPRVVDLDGDEADEVFSALASDTARSIYRAVHEEPRTPSDIAEAVDTSIQNVRYHLENLEEAGLVEVVDTWYSSRGNEMSVYAPASDALVFASDEGEASRLREALSRVVGGVAVLALASLFVQRLVRRYFGGSGGDYSSLSAGGAGGDDGAAPEGATTTEPAAGGAPETTAAPSETAEVGIERVTTTDAATDTPSAMATDGGNVTEPATQATTTATEAAASGATDAAAGLPPGLLFFAGGLVVLLAVVGYWYWSAGR